MSCPTKLHRRKLGIVVVIYLLATVAVGTCITFALEEQDPDSLLAIVAGALGGFLTVTYSWIVYAKAQRAIWRRTKGYPFSKGDYVEVTCGSKRDARGRVVSADQGNTYFEVAFDDQSDQPYMAWLSARKLRRREGIGRGAENEGRKTQGGKRDRFV